MSKKEQILILISEGKSAKEISTLLNCNTALIYYYTNHNKNLIKYKEKRKDELFKKSQQLSTNKIKLRNRRIVLEYLQEHPCIDCGNTDIRVLEFDHVRGDKIDSVSVGVKDSWSVNKLIQEINKCEIRCANCHKIVTDERRLNKPIITK